MTKKTFAIYFGLVVLALSLFASTAFASTATSINVKDVDAAARRPFQPTQVSFSAPSGQFTHQNLTTVPAGYRLVIEHASGSCSNVTSVRFSTLLSGLENSGQYLPQDLWSGKVISAPIRLYVNPGEDLEFLVDNNTGQTGYCQMYVSGYYVTLP